MLKSRCCLCCSLVGIIISAVVAVTLALLVNPIAYAWVQFLIMCSWTLLALVLLGFLIMAIVTAYHRNEVIQHNMCKNLGLLLVGTIGTLIVTAIFSLLISAGLLSAIIIQVFVSITVFFVGIMLSAVLCFITGIVKHFCHCR